MKNKLFLICFLTLVSFTATAVIEKESLKGINPETVGVIDSNHASIPSNLWDGLTHKEVSHLIKNLPNRFQNIFWANLQVALLTATMKVPEKGDGEQNILNIRFKKLMEMEAFESAYNLGKKSPDQLDQDTWAWCRLMHFLTHNNYDKAFKISQENALKDTHNKWQYAVIALQLLMDKKKEAKFSLALLEKENAEQDMVFIKAIKNILANKSVELGEGIDRPLILKLLLSKNSVPEKIEIETLSFGMINLIINDPGFDSFSDRMQLSILEYHVEHDESKVDLLKKKYNTLATKDEEETLLKKIENKEYDDKNDPLVRAFLYKFFEQTEDEESKKKAFYAFYLNAYRNKILPVAMACFGKDFNLPASNYDKDYAFAFTLHNIMLGNISYVQAWMGGLKEKQLLELALMILLRFDADKFSEKTKALLQKELHEPKYDPSLTFLYESKLEDLPAQTPQALKLSDNRLLDVLAGRYGFGKALGVLLSAASTISETDIWQTAVHVRVLNAIGLKQQAKDLLTFHAYPQLKGSE